MSSPTPPAISANAAVRHGRYEFLDALRGVAAMTVVFQHSLELVYPHYSRWTLTYFRPGEFGVTVFFLCSGFIIPASLERRGSQGQFWVGRFFRLYPAYWVALAAVYLLHFGFGRYPLDPQYGIHPLRLGLANATMAQNFLGVPIALGQSWTLAYELTFYAVVAALFVAGLHRRSSVVALIGFAVAAVVGSQLIPVKALVGATPLRIGVVLALTVVAAAAALLATRGVGPQRLLTVAVAVIAVPAIANRPEIFSTAAFFLATLFAGTAIYRWTAGQLSDGGLALVLAAAVASIVAMYFTVNVYWLDAAAGDALKRASMLTSLAAYAVFMAVLFAKDRHFPRPLLYLGTISYSLYLSHSIVIYGLGQVGPGRAGSVAVWVGLTVLVSAVTYRFVERPAIALGRRPYGRSGVVAKTA